LAATVSSCTHPRRAGYVPLMRILILVLVVLAIIALLIFIFGRRRR
jgi:hypothetical protein